MAKIFDSTTEEPPQKKIKEALPSSLSSLPDEVVLSCLARVSKRDHAAFSLVSKSYNSLAVSPDLYTTRSLLGCTEDYLYVSLRIPPPGAKSSRWFICTKKTSNRLCQIASFPLQPLKSSVVALGWGIYVIGGKVNGKRSSSVMLLDCRSHKWQYVPSMSVARASAAAGVVDGKIYVFGGCVEDTDYWGEVFDPKTQIWDSLPIPDVNIRCNLIHGTDGSVVMENKIYAGMDSSVRNIYYSPLECKWRKSNWDSKLVYANCCVIDELLYSCDDLGNLFWCEAKEVKWCYPNKMVWRKVKGLKALKNSILGSRTVQLDICGFSMTYDNGISRMSSFGRNIVVFWDMVHDETLVIWCAEISLESRHGGEIWGNIEWSDAVMTTDSLLFSPEVLHSVSVNV